MKLIIVVLFYTVCIKSRESFLKTGKIAMIDIRPCPNNINIRITKGLWTVVRVNALIVVQIAVFAMLMRIDRAIKVQCRVNAPRRGTKVTAIIPGDSLDDTPFHVNNCRKQRNCQIVRSVHLKKVTTTMMI